MPLILLADDDFVVLARLQDVLISGGFDVVTASDGAEAHAICGTEPVDFVLTDHDMPKMTGLELGGKIKGRIPFAIMCSLNIKREALDAGAVAFFQKPIKPREIVDCVATHTER